MSISSIKKILLAGTALVAASAFSTPAHAVAHTLAAPGTWASGGTHTGATAGDVTDAAATDAVDTSTFLLTITNDGTADDNSGNKNTFAPGAITGTTGGFTSAVGSANDLSVTIASGTFTGAAPITVTNTGQAWANATTVTGALSTVGGTVAVTNTDAASAKVVGLTIGGAASLTGPVNITAGDFAGANAVLTLNNATNTLGVVTLTDGAAGSAQLVIAGTGAQTITSIDGNADGKGTLTLSGNGSTVSGAVGATHSLAVVNAAGNGNTNTFSGNVSATTVNVTGTGEVDFGGNVTATTLAYGANTGIVSLASGKNLTAAVTGTGAGTLTFAGGTQGATGVINDSNLIINGGANSAATTFNSAVTAATINVTGTGSEQFKDNTAGDLVFAAAAGSATVDAGKTFTGSLNGTGGTATVGIGNVTFSGASSGITTIGDTGYLKSLTLSGTGTTVATTGAVKAATTTTLGTNTLSTGGQFDLVAGQTLLATATGTGTGIGNVATTGDINVDGDSIIKLTNVANVGTYSIVTGTTAGGTVAAANAGKLYVNGVANTVIGTTNFTAGRLTVHETVSATDVSLVVAQAAISSALGSEITTNDVAVGTAVDAIGLAGGAELDTFQTALNSAGSTAQVHSLLQSVSPTVDGSTQQAALDVGAETMGVTDVRIASLRDGDTTSGVAAGASANGVSMWVQGYGQHANQDDRSGVSGYSADTYGGVVGTDTTALLDRAILGIAFNYGHSNIDSDNSNTTSTDMDNYGVTLYGNYDLGDRMFATGQLGYAYNTIDTTRHNVGGVAGQNAIGSTNSDQFSAKAGLGRDYPMGGDMTLTPDVSAAYTYLNTDGYTETGAGGLNQVVSGNDTSVLNLGIGATASWKFKDADENVLKPALHVGYAYDAIGDTISTTSSFSGVPATTFTTSGPEPARSTFDFGGKLIYSTQANWDVSATYDFQVKQDYTSHTGAIRVTAHF